MHHSTGGRPASTPTTMDYTTQGDPNQVAPPTYINTAQATAQNQFFCTNNFFVPDGSNRHIHEIWDKVFHARYLENGNNAYLLGLKDMLHTSRFLMDETSGQFYAVYGNTYQCMSTKPMFEQTWGTGELIDQLAVMQQAFGYAGLSGPKPLLNQSQPAARTTCNQQDDILSKKPAPKTVQYQPPFFNLDRPTMHLTMEERIQVHPITRHKKDLINRLKRSDPQNIPAYEAEMTRHMTLHEDVLGRILTILNRTTITELWKNYQSSIVLQLMMTSSSSLNFMTPPPSLRESPVRQISSKDNLGNQVCTPHPKPLYLLLLVLYKDLLPHFSLLHQLPHQKRLTLPSLAGVAALKSLITLYINICKITFFPSTQFAYIYAIIFICKLC